MECELEKTRGVLSDKQVHAQDSDKRNCKARAQTHRHGDHFTPSYGVSFGLGQVRSLKP